jgi:hypothetical protein
MQNHKKKKKNISQHAQQIKEVFESVTTIIFKVFFIWKYIKIIFLKISFNNIKKIN